MIRPTRAHTFRMVAGIVGMVVLCGLVASTLESNVFNSLAASGRRGGEIGIFHALFWTDFAYALLPILGVVGIGCMLVYDRIELQRRTGYSLSIFDRVFEHTRNGLAVLDGQGRVENINPAYARMTGYTEAELQGRKLRELNSGRQSLQFYEDIWNAVNEQGHWEGEIWNRKKDGSLYLESIAVKGLDQRESGGYDHYMVVITDITQRHLDREYLGYLALHDALTGLPNRLQFADRIEQAMARARRASSALAVLFIDLDGFKLINDTCGHAGGDAVLKVVADRLRHALRGTDTVARLSGDEFTVMLEGLGASDSAGHIEQIAHMLLTSLSQPIDVGGHRVSVGASIGVSLYPEAKNFQELLDQADQAMYRAKAQGKNRVCFYSASDESESEAAAA